MLKAQAPGCPMVDAGPDQNVTCQDSCVTLTASPFYTGETTAYSVRSITYAPPFGFTGGTQLFISADDIFSGPLSLPFQFCFYGNNYTQAVVGANGLITFDLSLASQFCAWAFTYQMVGGPPPNGAYFNSINGAYHDIDPSVPGSNPNINYAILGTAPCRSFVLNYYHVAHFQCNSIYTTQQIVLYETTNVIEVYIEDKPTCNSWNDGNAVIGIQNATGTLGVVAPGRNTGPWTAHHEAWQFTPAGTPNVSVNWYDANSNLLATSAVIHVCPKTSTYYTAEAVYDRCDGTTIAVQDQVNVDVTPPATASGTSTDETCYGACDGTITMTMTGGITPYSYDIGNGLQSSNVFNGLCAGNYTVYTVDGGGCRDTVMFTIAPGIQISASDNTVDELCFGDNDGQATLTGSGGAAPYTYDIGAGPTNQTGLFTGLPPNTYNYTVTDANGCSTTGSFTINAGPICCTGTPTISSLDETCSGDCDGEINITISGGAPPITFDIGNGQVSSGVFQNLCSGSYSVTIADGLGCTEIRNFTIDPGTTVSVSTSTTDESCLGTNDGTATLVASGGTTPYTYDIGAGPTNQSGLFSGLPGNTYNYTVTDNEGCTATGSFTINSGRTVIATVNYTPETCSGDNDGTITLSASGGIGIYTYDIGFGPTNNTGVFTSLPANTYYYTITDNSNSCPASGSITIAAGATITVNEGITDELCAGNNDGTANLTASGGTAPYTYDIGVGPANITGQFSNLSPNTYNYTVTDDNGCFTTGSFTIAAGNTLSVTLSTTDETCVGTVDGAVTLTATGTASPFTYNIGLVPANQTGVFSGLPGGPYNYTVTDNDGCTITGSFTINSGPTVTATEAFTDEVCFGNNDGTITLTAASGTPPYTYDIGSGPTNATGVFTGLAPNTYNYTVTDNVGSCPATGTITIAAGSTVTATEVVTDEACAGNNDGAVSITASGGTMPYTYDIGTVSSNQTGLFTNLSPNTYSYTVTDVNGCQITGGFTVNAGSFLSASVNTVDETCSGADDGTATITVGGGTSPYTFSLVSGPSNNTGIFNGLADGTYNYSIVDANGCNLTGNFTIDPGITLNVSGVITPVTCPGGLDGAIDLTVTGGTTVLYEWSNTAISEDVSNLQSGIYRVTVTDLVGCVIIDSFNVTEPDNIVIDAIVQDVTCAGFDDGLINVTTTGGTGPFTYSWSNSAVTEDVFNLPPDTYTVVATDQNNCTATATFTINTPDSLVIDLAATDATCGLDNGSILINPNGGTQPYNIVWQDSSHSDQQVGIASGNYSVTVTDANNCVNSEDVTIADTPPMQIDAGPNDSIHAGDTATLNPSFDDAGLMASVYWTPDADLSCGDCTNPDANPEQTTTYTLTVEDTNGCVYYDDVEIFVSDEKIIYIPNVFTPNGDGRNDEFRVFGKNIERIRMKIFDRWGEMVFESNDINVGWDGTQNGKDKNPAVFVYWVKVDFRNGRSEFYEGSLTLLR